MKFLILFMLLISCTDNKQSTENSTTQTIEVVEEIIEPPAPELVIASYDKGLPLLKLSKNIYWHSNQNQYYLAQEQIITNQIVYTLDEILSTNYIYYTNGGAIMGDNLTYIGSISPLERVYLNSQQQQIFQKLQSIDDSYILCYDGKKFQNTEYVYPTTITLYTNNLGEGFYRPTDQLTPLEPNEFRYKSNLVEI